MEWHQFDQGSLMDFGSNNYCGGVQSSSFTTGKRHPACSIWHLINVHHPANRTSIQSASNPKRLLSMYFDSLDRTPQLPLCHYYMGLTKLRYDNSALLTAFETLFQQLQKSTMFGNPQRKEQTTTNRVSPYTEKKTNNDFRKTSKRYGEQHNING